MCSTLPGPLRFGSVIGFHRFYVVNGKSLGEYPRDTEAVSSRMPRVADGLAVGDMSAGADSRAVRKARADSRPVVMNILVAAVVVVVVVEDSLAADMMMMDGVDISRNDQHCLVVCSLLNRSTHQQPT